MSLRPKPPKVFDITSEGYHEHNRYFNQAEKIFDKLEKHFFPAGYIDCATCRDCGRIVHDYHIPDEIWNDVIGSPRGVWCYDCFCAMADKKGYVAVFRCELVHPKKSEFNKNNEEVKA